jgi:hypothetical protein
MTVMARTPVLPLGGPGAAAVRPTANSTATIHNDRLTSIRDIPRFLRRVWNVFNVGMARALGSIVIRLVDRVAVQSEFAAKFQLDAIGKETSWQ